MTVAPSMSVDAQFIRPINPTVLSDWAFKFAPGNRFGIVLVGYKRPDKVGAYAGIWGSSPIVSRINATTLASRSTQYKLEGPICEKEARKLGLPVSFISMFQNGFPENWMTVLQEYWNNLHSREFPSSMSLNTDIAPNRPIVLSSWVFKFAEGNRFGLILEGFKNTDDFGEYSGFWGSSPIVRRIDATTLATKSNTQYKLDGPICEKNFRKLALPVSLISMFRNGFPENWLNILTAYWNKLRETNVQNAADWFDRTAYLYDLNTPLNNEISQLSMNRCTTGEGRPIQVVRPQILSPARNGRSH